MVTKQADTAMPGDYIVNTADLKQIKKVCNTAVN